MLEDALVHDGAEIVRVGDEQVLLALGEEIVEDTRVEKGVVQVTVTRRIPVLLVVIGTLRAGEKGLLEDTGVAGLVEGGDADLLVGVFFDDAEGVLVRVEGSHEDEGDIDTVGGVEVLDLTNGEVEEGHIVLDLESTLGTGHAHGGSETTVHLENGELGEIGRVLGLREIGIGHDLICSRRLDLVPVKFDVLGTFGEITRKEIEEGLHLGVEGLFVRRIFDRRNEPGELVAHGLCGDTGSGCLKVDMGGTADAGAVGVAPGHKRHGYRRWAVDVDGGGGGGGYELRRRICPR